MRNACCLPLSVHSVPTILTNFRKWGLHAVGSAHFRKFATFYPKVLKMHVFEGKIHQTQNGNNKILHPEIYSLWDLPIPKPIPIPIPVKSQDKNFRLIPSRKIPGYRDFAKSRPGSPEIENSWSCWSLVVDSTFQRMAFFFWTFFVCMTNQHASTDKSTIHSDRRYRQPAGDQGAGAERMYFYAYSNLQQKARKNDARFQGHLPPQDQQA